MSMVPPPVRLTFPLSVILPVLTSGPPVAAVMFREIDAKFTLPLTVAVPLVLFAVILPPMRPVSVPLPNRSVPVDEKAILPNVFEALLGTTTVPAFDRVKVEPTGMFTPPFTVTVLPAATPIDPDQVGVEVI